jgi:hypothetical protein
MVAQLVVFRVVLSSTELVSSLSRVPFFCHFLVLSPPVSSLAVSAATYTQLPTAPVTESPAEHKTLHSLDQSPA